MKFIVETQRADDPGRSSHEERGLKFEVGDTLASYGKSLLA